MIRSTILSGAAVLALCAIGAVTAKAQPPEGASTAVSSATGAISQLNYGPGGQVQGFLIGTNILLSFPMNICGGLSTLGAVGNNVTYSGNAFTATSGFQTVRVSSFTNNTTKATYTAPAASSSTAYGPTSGVIKQLNYATGGSIDGFLFTASGTSPVFVFTGPHASSTLTPLLTVGATVSVTGTTSPRVNACSSTGAIEVVNASSLTINGQTVVIANGGHGGGPGGGMPGHH